VFTGLRDDGYLLVNTSKSFAELHIEEPVGRLPKGHAVIVPATDFALKHIGRPVPNAALLGAFAALTRFVNIENVKRAIEDAFPGKVGAANIAAAVDAYEFISWQQHAASAA
jgi:pyruvate ferredoxin oxidoreductase gamma subunit